MILYKFVLVINRFVIQVVSNNWFLYYIITYLKDCYIFYINFIDVGIVCIEIFYINYNFDIKNIEYLFIKSGTYLACFPRGDIY